MGEQAFAELNELSDPIQLSRLSSLLRGAHGPISQVHISYPGVPEIEFGDKSGARWVVGPEGSDWQLVDSIGSQLVSSKESNAVYALADHLATGAVESLELREKGSDLLVNFADGCRLVVQGHDDETELPAWEVFTPGRRVVAVGPGPFWLQYHATVPEQDVPWLNREKSEAFRIGSGAQWRKPGRAIWAARRARRSRRAALLFATLLLLAAAVVVSFEENTAFALSNVLIFLGILTVVFAFWRDLF
jgi:hypothetical protein